MPGTNFSQGNDSVGEPTHVRLGQAYLELRAAMEERRELLQRLLSVERALMAAKKQFDTVQEEAAKELGALAGEVKSSADLEAVGRNSGWYGLASHEAVRGEQ